MLQIYNKYNPNANPANTDYPNGSGKDESVSGANDGTPLEMSWYNDMLGFSEALLLQGRLTPSGNADTALVSDRLDGFRLAALRVQTACDYTDGDLSLVDVIYVGLDITTVEYVIDHNTLTRWAVGAATGTVTADDLNVGTGALSGVTGALINKTVGTIESDVSTNTGNVTELSTANNARTKAALNATGSAPIYAIRAWINFDMTSTPTQRTGGNILAIVDNGVGDCTLEFAVSMPTPNFVPLIGRVSSTTGNVGNGGLVVAGSGSGSSIPLEKTVSKIRLHNFINATTKADSFDNNIAFMG